MLPSSFVHCYHKYRSPTQAAGALPSGQQSKWRQKPVQMENHNCPTSLYTKKTPKKKLEQLFTNHLRLTNLISAPVLERRAHFAVPFASFPRNQSSSLGTNAHKPGLEHGRVTECWSMFAVLLDQIPVFGLLISPFGWGFE